jgi:RNA polymerase sigma-70 factor (ECF subfamily)
VDHALPLVGISILKTPPPKSSPTALPAPTASLSPQAAAPFAQRLQAAAPELGTYARKLLRYGKTAAGRHVDDEDLVQDTLARALVFQANFDASRPLGPWLKRMLLRLFLDQRRKAYGAPELSLNPTAKDGLPLEELPAERTRSAHLEDEDEARFLLGQLEDPERSILDRFHRQGESIAAISTALNIPIGTTKSHLHRARLRLREICERRATMAAACKTQNPDLATQDGERLHE